MQKFIYTSLILALFISPGVVVAQYYSSNNYNNSNQIAQIQAQINSLYAQLATLQNQSSYAYSYIPTPTYSTYYSYGNVSGAYAGSACNFTVNLALGDNNSQVADLNRILGVNTGSSYFGQDTYSAVVRFQNMYASEVLMPAGLIYPTGMVGAFTRAKLNQSCNGISANLGGSVLGASSYYNPYMSGNYNNTNYNYQYPYTNQYQYNQYNYVAPTVTLTANSQSVPRGSGVTLSWNSNYSTSCSASSFPTASVWSGTKGQGGAEFVSRIDTFTTFLLTCTSTYSGLSAGASVTVNVY